MKPGSTVGIAELTDKCKFVALEDGAVLFGEVECPPASNIVGLT
jgi:hypothetical protein